MYVCLFVLHVCIPFVFVCRHISVCFACSVFININNKRTEFVA